MADVALQGEWSLAEEQALQLSKAAINRFIFRNKSKPQTLPLSLGPPPQRRSSLL